VPDEGVEGADEQIVAGLYRRLGQRGTCTIVTYGIMRQRIEALLASEPEQWKKVSEQVGKVRDMFGPKTPLGKRRTTFADAPEHDLAAIEEAFVEREPVTVVVSDKGWIRTMKGHVEDLSGLAFKQDDKLGFAFFAETTSKLLLFATNGKFYSLDVAKLPGGRGRVELLLRHDQVHAEGLELRDELDELPHGSGQAVEPRRDHHVDLSGARRGAEGLVAGAIGGGAGAVIEEDVPLLEREAARGDEGAEAQLVTVEGAGLLALPR